MASGQNRPDIVTIVAGELTGWDSGPDGVHLHTEVPGGPRFTIYVRPHQPVVRLAFGSPQELNPEVLAYLQKHTGSKADRANPLRVYARWRGGQLERVTLSQLDLGNNTPETLGSFPDGCHSGSFLHTQEREGHIPKYLAHRRAELLPVPKGVHPGYPIAVGVQPTEVETRPDGVHVVKEAKLSSVEMVRAETLLPGGAELDALMFKPVIYGDLMPFLTPAGPPQEFCLPPEFCDEPATGANFIIVDDPRNPAPPTKLDRREGMEFEVELAGRADDGTPIEMVEYGPGESPPLLWKHIKDGDRKAPKPEGVLRVGATIASERFLTKGRLTPEERKKIVDAIKQQYAGTRAEEKLVFLPDEFEVKDVTPCPRETDFVEPVAAVMALTRLADATGKRINLDLRTPAPTVVVQSRTHADDVGAYIVGRDGDPVTAEGWPVLRPGIEVVPCPVMSAIAEAVGDTPVSVTMTPNGIVAREVAPGPKDFTPDGGVEVVPIQFDDELITAPGAWTMNEKNVCVNLSNPDGPGNEWPGWYRRNVAEKNRNGLAAEDDEDVGPTIVVG